MFVFTIRCRRTEYLRSLQSTPSSCTDERRSGSAAPGSDAPVLSAPSSTSSSSGGGPPPAAPQAPNNQQIDPAGARGPPAAPQAPNNQQIGGPPPAAPQAPNNQQIDPAGAPQAPNNQQIDPAGDASSPWGYARRAGALLQRIGAEFYNGLFGQGSADMRGPDLLAILGVLEGDPVWRAEREALGLELVFLGGSSDGGDAKVVLDETVMSSGAGSRKLLQDSCDGAEVVFML